MKVVLNQLTIQAINVFQNLTGSSVIDCIVESDEIYFVVADGHYGLSVGKGGVKIKHAERLFKKPIKVFEYAPDPKAFIKKVFPEAQEVEISGGVMSVKIKQADKPKAIGKSGKNIKVMNKILKRLFGIEKIRIK